MGRRYILEGLSHRRLCEHGCVGDYLGRLPTSSVSEGAEVRHVIDAWLTWSSTLVACHMPSTRQAVDEVVEGMPRGYVCEYLRVGVFGEASSIRDHLGELSPSHWVIRSEGAVRVT